MREGADNILRRTKEQGPAKWRKLEFGEQSAFVGLLKGWKVLYVIEDTVLMLFV